MSLCTQIVVYLAIVAAFAALARAEHDTWRR
jgi:hypothetical protein